MPMPGKLGMGFFMEFVMSCEFVCSYCKVATTSIANGICHCPQCGTITSMYAPPMIPEMSKMIFEARRSMGEDVYNGSFKIHYGYQEEKPVFKVVSDEE